MHSAPISNVNPTTMVKMQSSATIYGVGMIQASIFNLISTMMFFMRSGDCFGTFFNIYIIQIHFLMAFNEKGLTIASKHWIIDDITISKAFE
jgi:drug/metabolite transporter superfamily protein YnfA